MLLHVKILYLRRNFDRQLAYVVTRGRTTATDAITDAVPEFLDAFAIRCNNTDVGNYWAPRLRISQLHCLKPDARKQRCSRLLIFGISIAKLLNERGFLNANPYN